MNLNMNDVLALAVCNLKPRLDEVERKKLGKIFQDYGLRITSLANAKNVNFLDINLDLKETYTNHT